MKNILKIIFAFFLWINIITITTSNSKNQNMPVEYTFSNNDIKWDASLIGVYPILSNNALTFRNNYPENGDSLMLEYLKNEEKFIFAHVILSLNYNKQEYSNGMWNNLSITLNADGSVTYNLQEIKDIENMWLSIIK